MKKVLVSDYDQTLYLDDEGIEVNKLAIRKFRDAGNIFIIATGRSFMDFKKKSDAYSLEYDYVILNHGSIILDNKDNVIFCETIDKNIVQDIKKNIHLEKSISHFCCGLFESRVDFDYKDLTKIEAKYSNKEDAWSTNESINKKYSEYVNSYFLSSNSIEIISSKTNKSYAIEILINKLNISKKEVITVGDGYSDIEMVKNFNGYAMEDSVPELKEIAKGFVKSISELIEIMK